MHKCAFELRLSDKMYHLSLMYHDYAGSWSCFLCTRRSTKPRKDRELQKASEPTVHITQHKPNKLILSSSNIINLKTLVLNTKVLKSKKYYQWLLIYMLWNTVLKVSSIQLYSQIKSRSVLGLEVA